MEHTGFKESFPKTYGLHQPNKKNNQIINLKTHETMKELKDNSTINILEQQIPLIPRYRASIQWKLAKRKQISGLIQRANTMTEVYFNLILAEVKQLYAPLEPIVFERDFRECSGEYSCAMHSFITDSIYLHLECSFTMHYLFSYDFYSCPFEQQITSRIQRLFLMNDQSKRVNLKPNCLEYFNSVIKTQEPQYTSVLKVD